MLSGTTSIPLLRQNKTWYLLGVDTGQLKLDFSVCQVNGNCLQKFTSPKSAVALCWSSRCAQRTVIWFNSGPLKSHPGSIIIRLLVLPCHGQSEVNPKADLWGTNLTRTQIALFWILMLTNGADCLPRLLNRFFSLSPLPLGEAFQGQKFERDGH